MKETASLLAIFVTHLAVYAGNVDVVILTGSNNHNWQATTSLRAAPSRTGRNCRIIG